MGAGCRSIKPLPSYGDLKVFQHLPSVISHLFNVEFLTTSAIQRGRIMHRRA